MGLWKVAAIVSSLLQDTQEWVPFIFADTRRRFWAKVDVRDDTECWLWTAYIDPGGYGNIRIEGRTVRSHVLAYVLHTGDTDLDGYQIRHSPYCQFNHCSNPHHMTKGSAQENQFDRFRAGTDASQRLSREDVLEVAELIDSEWTDREIADRFNVNRTTIYNIRIGSSWSWLTGR